MRTIAQQWTTFELAVLSPDASSVQRREMRRAFYVGFDCALRSMLEIGAESGDSEDAGVSMMQDLHRECHEFARAVAQGKA